MSNLQIPNLPAAIALNGTEQLEAVQAGTSVRITTALLASFFRPVVVTSATITSNTLNINLLGNTALVVVVYNNATLNDIVVTGLVPGQMTGYVLRFVSDGFQRTQPVFFNGAYSFPEGVPLTTSAVANAVDTLTLVSWGGDGNWEGFVSNVGSVVVL